MAGRTVVFVCMYSRYIGKKRPASMKAGLFGWYACYTIPGTVALFLGG